MADATAEPAAEPRPDDAPYLPAPIDDRPAFLVRDKPLIDSIPDRWIGYLHATVAIAEDPRQHPITKAEVGVFIELCARYMLDPFAKEAWLAKSKRGKLLTMVGRDGLRKIAQRNGLHVDGDVVHEGDAFTVSRTPDGNRTVTHEYTITGERGKILGAWAEVRDGGPLGRPMGFFWAPLSEYKPSGASEYSVWSKQTSVMILGAAERTAVRQATPLAGLVAFGEHESAFARETLGDGRGNGEPAGIDLGPDVEAVIQRGTELGHPTICEANRGTIELAVGGQPPGRVATWVAERTAELDAIPVDAEVVDGEPAEARQRPVSPSVAQTGDSTSEGQNAPHAQRTAGEAGESQPDPERIEALRARALDLLAEADGMDMSGDPRAEEVREEAERIMAEVDAVADENQIGLGF